MVAVEPGQTVLPGQMVARLVALDTVRLVIGVVESKAPLLRVGQVVDVELLALRAAAAKRLDAVEAGRPRRGKVVILPPAADPRTGLFNVEVELDNAQGHLLPGMVGKASIRVETRQGYAIPAEAVVRAGTDDLWAFFIDNGMGVGVDLGALGHSEAQVRVPVVRRVKINPLLTRRDVYYVDQLPSGQQKLVVEGQARLSDLQPVSVIDMGTIGRVADRS
jgi:Cu(I)/Ag(I) efflux system membrane fusion protein